MTRVMILGSLCDDGRVQANAFGCMEYILHLQDI